MKKYLSILLIILSFYLGIYNVSALDLNIDSKNAILYNLDEGTILYEKDSKEQISIASMTKIMTAIVALEHIDNLDKTIILTNADFYGLVEANASVAGFWSGQRVTYRDLLYGLLLPSGADAAQALTRNIAGSKSAFIALMNAKAKELGLKNTHFMNETGLDEEGHYSTVEEVATILKYALENEEFKKIITSSSYTMSDKSFTVYNTIDKNKRRYGLDMDYLEGGKTGTTFDAGLCLASIASYQGVHYMLVTARAPYNEGPKNLYDAQTIYEYFMDHYGNKVVVEKGKTLLTLKTLYAKENTVSFESNEEIIKYLPNDFDKNALEYQYDGIEVLESNIKAGTKLGTVKIKYQDEILYEQDIILDEQLTFSLSKYLKAHIEFVIIGVVVVILIMITIFISIQKKRRRRKKRRQNLVYKNKLCK